jgi:hypothetical protein
LNNQIWFYFTEEISVSITILAGFTAGGSSSSSMSPSSSAIYICNYFFFN